MQLEKFKIDFFLLWLDQREIPDLCQFYLS